MTNYSEPIQRGAIVSLMSAACREHQLNVCEADIQFYLDVAHPNDAVNVHLKNVNDVWTMLWADINAFNTISYATLRWFTDVLIYRGLQLNSVQLFCKSPLIHLVCRFNLLWTQVLLDLPIDYGLNINACDDSGDSLLRLAIGLSGGAYRNDSSILSIVRQILDRSSSDVLSRSQILRMFDGDMIRKKHIQQIASWINDSACDDGTRLYAHLDHFQNRTPFAATRQRILHYRDTFPKLLRTYTEALDLIADLSEIVECFILG